MSTQSPTYEETVTKVANLEKLLLESQTHAAAKYKGKEHDDKEMEASFKKAQEEMKDKDKEHQATHDDMEKVKDAFKKAEDESDPEKKKEAMKKAMEMKDDHDKKAKKAEDMPKENVDKQPQHEAAIAAIVMKKIPLMQKILEATKIMDSSNYDKVEKQLEAATLDEVQEKYDSIAPYIAAIGLGTKSPAQQGERMMVPFAASSVLTDKSTDIFSANSTNIDFSKVSTEAIMEMHS